MQRSIGLKRHEMNVGEKSPIREAVLDAGLRLTGPRLAIYRALLKKGLHPSAEDVYRLLAPDLPSLSRDTVYRTLATFEEAGLIRKFPSGDGVFRYDALMDPHHHFICSRCLKIVDVSLKETGPVRIPDSLRSLGVIETVQMEFRGICLSCASRVRRASPCGQARSTGFLENHPGEKR